jgi:hypothetical protein
MEIIYLILVCLFCYYLQNEMFPKNRSNFEILEKINKEQK